MVIPATLIAYYSGDIHKVSLFNKNSFALLLESLQNGEKSVEENTVETIATHIIYSRKRFRFSLWNMTDGASHFLLFNFCSHVSWGKIDYLVFSLTGSLPERRTLHTPNN